MNSNEVCSCVCLFKSWPKLPRNGYGKVNMEVETFDNDELNVKDDTKILFWIEKD